MISERRGGIPIAPLQRVEPVESLLTIGQELPSCGLVLNRKPHDRQNQNAQHDERDMPTSNSTRRNAVVLARHASLPWRFRMHASPPFKKVGSAAAPGAGVNNPP